MHWGMSDSRWTIIPPWLGWPLAVSLWQRVPLLPSSCKRSGGASPCSTWGWLLWVGRDFTQQAGVTAQSLAPSLLQMNPTETGLQSWTSVGKWISVKDRGVWEPSAHPTSAGEVCGWEKKQGKPQCYTSCCFLLLLLSSGQTREDPGLGSSTISGNAAHPPCFLGPLLSLDLFPSVLQLCLCFAPSPRLK